jgi:hypothetical protein
MAGLIWIPAFAGMRRAKDSGFDLDSRLRGMRRAKHGGFDLDSRLRGNEAGEAWRV